MPFQLKGSGLGGSPATFRLPLATFYKSGLTYKVQYADGTSGASSTTLSTVVNAAIALAVTAGGGRLAFTPAVYNGNDIICNAGDAVLPICIDAYGATFRPLANDKTIWTITQNANETQRKLFYMLGAHFENNAKTGCCAVQIKDTYGATFHDISVRGVTELWDSGLYFYCTGNTKFGESPVVTNSHFTYATDCIKFLRNAGTGSFDNAFLLHNTFRISADTCDGIHLGVGNHFSRSQFLDNHFWFSKADPTNQNGMNIDCLNIDGGHIRISGEVDYSGAVTTCYLIKLTANLSTLVNCEIIYNYIQTGGALTKILDNSSNIPVGSIRKVGEASPLICCGNTLTDLKTDGTAEYMGIYGSTTPNTTRSTKEQVMPHAGHACHARVYLVNDPASGNSRTFTLYKNGAATTITITISGSDTTGVDDTHFVSIAAGDVLSWYSDGGVSAPDASMASYSFVFVPHSTLALYESD